MGGGPGRRSLFGLELLLGQGDRNGRILDLARDRLNGGEIVAPPDGLGAGGGHRTEESTREGSKLLARYMEDHPEMAPAGSSGSAPDFGTLLVALNDATERKVRPVLARFDHQLQQQQQFVERFRYVSPAIVAQAAIQDLAGSGTHRYQHFLAQVDAYHQRWREYFVPRILRKQQLTGSDLDLLPQFTYQQEDNAAVMWRCMQALGSLCVPLILLGVPAMVALRRYRVAG